MKSALKLFWIALPVKLILAAILPMTADEAYYWVWSHHPQLNYYDHPAMVSWLFLLGQPLEHVLSFVRWPGVLLSHGTLFVWMIILKDHLKFSDDQINNWLWLALLSPLYGAGALIITPDIPLLFFWSLGALCFLKLIETPSWRMAFGFGVVLGLGLVSKYMIVLLPLSLIVASLWRLNWWKRVGWNLIYIFIGFALGALPFFLWNIQNDWISIRFQLDHGLGAAQWKPSWTIDYILLQIGLIFPPIVYLIFKGISKSTPWLTALAFVPLLFFFQTSFKGYVEANWPITAYPALLAIAVLGGGQKIQVITRWIWGVLIAVLFLLISTQYSPFQKPIKTREFFEFETLYDTARTKEPLFARSYQMASRLSFESKKMIYKLRGFNRKDSFDFWEGSLPPDQFYLILNLDETLPESYQEQGFKVVEETVVGERFKLLKIRKED